MEGLFDYGFSRSQANARTGIAECVQVEDEYLCTVPYRPLYDTVCLVEDAGVDCLREEAALHLSVPTEGTDLILFADRSQGDCSA
jgi:hypothetical protein